MRFKLLPTVGDRRERHLPPHARAKAGTWPARPFRRLAELRGRSKPKDAGDKLEEGRLANPKPHSLGSRMPSNPRGRQTGDPPTKSRCQCVHSHRVTAHLQSWTAHTPGAGPARRTPAPSSAGRQLPVQAPKRGGSQLLREGEPGTEMRDLSRRPSPAKSPKPICPLQGTAPVTVQWHHRKTAKPLGTLGLCPARQRGNRLPQWHSALHGMGT